MQKKPNDLGQKYGNQKNITKSQMNKQYDKTIRRAGRSPKVEIHTDLLKMIKKYQTGKHQAMMEYIVFGSRNSPPFITNQH